MNKLRCEFAELSDAVSDFVEGNWLGYRFEDLGEYRFMLGVLVRSFVFVLNIVEKFKVFLGFAVAKCRGLLEPLSRGAVVVRSLVEHS